MDRADTVSTSDNKTESLSSFVGAWDDQSYNSANDNTIFSDKEEEYLLNYSTESESAGDNQEDWPSVAQSIPFH